MINCIYIYIYIVLVRKNYRGYEKEMVHSEIQKINFLNRDNFLRKREKHDKDDSLTLVLAYHPALNKVH